eukprot:5508289-Prymnesium_polylepis.1
MYIDFRGGHGNIKQLDPNELALDPHYDAEALATEMAAAGDAEIADQWSRGVTFKAEMPHWVVIHPNLLNFWDNLDPATDELD